jgi:hypothetical protein
LLAFISKIQKRRERGKMKTEGKKRGRSSMGWRVRLGGFLFGSCWEVEGLKEAENSLGFPIELFLLKI